MTLQYNATSVLLGVGEADAGIFVNVGIALAVAVSIASETSPAGNVIRHEPPAQSISSE